jgi:hypothetical protein
MTAITDIQNRLWQENNVKVGKGLISKIISKLPIELHIPGYNYCGPGTKLDKRLGRGDKPVNRVDEVCMFHDIDYQTAGTDSAKIKAADQKMLRRLNEIQNPTIAERLGRTIASTGIKTKQLLGSGAKQSLVYCVKCRKKTPTKNVTEHKTKKGVKQLKGICEVCGSKKSSFLAKSSLQS